MKSKTFLFLILFCLFAIIGCTSSTDSKILGKWICKATKDRIEFSKDKTCKLDSMGFHYPCTWKILEDGRIRAESGQIVLTGNFNGDNLLFEDAIMHSKYLFEKEKTGAAK